MKQGLRVLGFLAVFGLGMLAGGSLLGVGHAQKPTTETVQPEAPMKHGANNEGCQCDCARGNQFLYANERIGIIQIPAPEDPKKLLTVLIDNRDYSMYTLTRSEANNYYYWRRIERN